MSSKDTQIVVDVAHGRFRREGLKIINADGRTLARLNVSTQVPTSKLEAVGDLLASAWELRDLLKHVLICSGSPADCRTCRRAANHAKD